MKGICYILFGIATFLFLPCVMVGQNVGEWQEPCDSSVAGKSLRQGGGNAHEDNTDINPMQHIYKNLKDADNAVDLLNNAIGRRIGINNKNATNQQMSGIVLEEYRTNGLWEAQKTNEGYKIQKTQLSQEKYNEALNVLRTKGNDGMNK